MKIIGDQRVGKMKNKKKVIGNTVFFSLHYLD